MSYKYSFADNESYGAQDVNKMVKRLVSSGVADPFTDGVPYNLSAFNSAGALVYTSGAVPETVYALKVVSAGTGKVLINPGTAFFADGAVIEIEAGGHELEIVSGVKNYVYLKNDLIASNTCYPVCSEEAPAGDFVPLAEISEAGEITDVRTYAKGKLPGYASSALYTMVISDNLNMKNGETAVKSYEVGDNSYRFLMAVNFAADSHALLGVYDFENGRYLSYAGLQSGASSSTVHLTLYNGYVEHAEAAVSLVSGVLTLSIQYYNGGGIGDSTRPVSYTLYLF